ncbi:MAG: hypothetical protein ACOX1X_02940 [Dethiobacteria bacterium]
MQNFTLSQGANTGEHLLHLTLANLGQGAARDISLTLDGGQSVYVTRGSNVSYLPEIKGNEKAKIEYFLGVNAGEGINFYPLNLSYGISGPLGKQIQSSQETVGINVAELYGSGSGASRR